MNIQISSHGEVTQSGGVTKYQHAPSEPTISPIQIDPTETQMRVGGQVYRHVEGQQVESVGVVRHQEGLAPTNQGSVMATLQRQGVHDTVQLIPGVESSRTRVETALRQGLIREVSPGFYVDAQPFQGIPTQQPQDGTNQDSNQDQQPQGEEAPYSYLDANTASLWNDAVSDIDQHSYDAAVASTVALVAAGEALDSVVQQLAAAEGMEIEEARDYVETGTATYKRALTADLEKSVGLPRQQSEQFYEWAKTHPHLRRALSNFMHEGSTKEFRSMALAWKRETSGKADTTAFKAAGFETRVDRDSGDLLIRKGNGNWLRARDLA